MKKYKDILLLEFLMFSKDIDKDILDFKISLQEFDEETIYELVEQMRKENIYTKQNIENLKKIIKFLKNKLNKYDEMIAILNFTKPSYDIYYYNYIEKYDVLRNYNYDTIIPVNFLEDSIRFDFYAFSALISEPKEYIENYFSSLVNNPLFLLFVNKVLNENPDILLDKNVLKRICSIIELNITSLENEEIIEYHQKLLKKVKYYAKNKKAEVYDYELFIYTKDKAFLEYLITSNIDFKNFHDYIISEHFLYFLEEYLEFFANPENERLFLYNSDMSENFKALIFYILEYKSDNKTKIRCNILLQKWFSHKVEDEEIFYEVESLKKCSLNEISFLKQKNILINEMKLSIRYDYYILEAYTLDGDDFDEIIEKINLEYFIKWMKKMMKINVNFFRNEMIREKTIKILEKLSSLEEPFDKEAFKMKRKIIKLNKGLE